MCFYLLINVFITLFLSGFLLYLVELGVLFFRLLLDVIGHGLLLSILLYLIQNSFMKFIIHGGYFSETSSITIKRFYEWGNGWLVSL